MITVEDKLDIFNKLIYKEEEEKCIKQLEGLDAKIKIALEDKKRELEKKKEEFINRKIILANNQKNEMISKANEDKKTNILKEREKLLEDTMKSLKIKAKGFVQSNDYEAYLISKVAKVLDEIDDVNIKLILNEEDIIRFQNSITGLQDKYKKNMVIEPANVYLIGGFMLRDIDETYNFDYSFRTIIEENKYEIGKKLFSLLESAGDLYG